MNRVLTYFFVVLIGLGVMAFPQTSVAPAPKKAAPSAEIFSGTVTKLTGESVTVVRKVPGHDAVTREFVRDAQTKIEGKLRERVRVTVRYRAVDEGGFVAVYIIVR